MWMLVDHHLPRGGLTMNESPQRWGGDEELIAHFTDPETIHETHATRRRAADGEDRYGHLRSQHPAVVYELVHQAELSIRGTAVPLAGPARERYLADVNRREDEAAAAPEDGVEAMIDLLKQWDLEASLVGGLQAMATHREDGR